jgi:hypothetical protein
MGSAGNADDGVALQGHFLAHLAEAAMWINRRTVLLAAGALLLSRHARAADPETALFWSVTPSGRKGAVLFGYERIAPQLAPDLVKDGDAFVDACTRVVLDMPQAIRFPTVGLGRPEIKPILQVVSPATADRLRIFLLATPAAAFVDRISGIEAMTLLMSEGQHVANSTVAGIIVDYARSAAKPMDQLVSEQEMQSAWHPPDLARLNNGIGDDQIAYLLDLRNKVGPIGGHLEQLYRQRKGEEIARVTAELIGHGMISPSKFIHTDRVQGLMLDRAMAMLTAEADETRFMLFPLGILTGASGMLAAFKAKGAAVEPLA